MSVKKILIAAVTSFTLVAAAHAGGVFSQYPQVGNIQNTQNPPGPAYSTTCESTGNNGVCNQFQPFGPTTLTGNEYIPADTGNPGGQNPQTVTVPIILLGAGNTNYSTPLTGTTVTVAPTDSTVLVEPAGTIAALTVALPAAATLKDGQTLRVVSTQNITALTMTPGTGSTMANPGATALTVSGTTAYNYEFMYRVATAKWYRIQ